MGKRDTAESMAVLDTNHCHPPLAAQHGSSQNLCISLFSSYPLFPQAWQSLSQGTTAVP